MLGVGEINSHLKAVGPSFLFFERTRKCLLFDNSIWQPLEIILICSLILQFGLLPRPIMHSNSVIIEIRWPSLNSCHRILVRVSRPHRKPVVSEFGSQSAPQSILNKNQVLIHRPVPRRRGSAAHSESSLASRAIQIQKTFNLNLKFACYAQSSKDHPSPSRGHVYDPSDTAIQSSSNSTPSQLPTLSSIGKQ